MTSHDLKTPEPVVSAQTVTVLVGAVAAAVGWAWNDVTVTAVAGGVWLVVSILATLIARGRVTPLAGGWQQQVEQIVEQAMEDTASRIVNQLAVPTTTPPVQAPQPASQFGLGRTAPRPPTADPSTAAFPTQQP